MRPGLFIRAARHWSIVPRSVTSILDLKISALGSDSDSRVV